MSETPGIVRSFSGVRWRREKLISEWENGEKYLII